MINTKTVVGRKDLKEIETYVGASPQLSVRITNYSVQFIWFNVQTIPHLECHQCQMELRLYPHKFARQVVKLLPEFAKETRKPLQEVPC